MAKRGAQGGGTIKHRSDGRWEARFTYVDKLGQSKRGSVYAKTQKECRQKLTEALKAIDEGSFRKTSRVHTVESWSGVWLDTYCNTLKPRTLDSYRAAIDRYIIPCLGKSKLTALLPEDVQGFVDLLSVGYKNQNPVSPKTVQNIHGVLHSMLRRAVLSGLITSNPSDNTKLPTVSKPKLEPLMDEAIPQFLKAIKGDPYENLFIIDLFSGLRQSELLGLKWEDVDWKKGTLHVCRQLQKVPRSKEYRFIDKTKNGEDRFVSLPPAVMNVLRQVQRQQTGWRLAAGEAWDNPHDLIFTDRLGGHLKHRTVYNHFKSAVTSIGHAPSRFHDLRHSAALIALESGVALKSVAEQMGHYSSSFTMDVYTPYSDALRTDTQNKLEAAFRRVSEL